MCGLQFLLIRRFGESDEIYAACTTIIARRTTLNLRIRPNIHSMYKSANILIVAWFHQLARLSVPLGYMSISTF